MLTNNGFPNVVKIAVNRDKFLILIGMKVNVPIAVFFCFDHPTGSFLGPGWLSLVAAGLGGRRASVVLAYRLF